MLKKEWNNYIFIPILLLLHFNQCYQNFFINFLHMYNKPAVTVFIEHPVFSIAVIFKI